MGYYLCDSTTKAVLHGPYSQLVHAFLHYVKGSTTIYHRRETGEFDIVSN